MCSGCFKGRIQSDRYRQSYFNEEEVGEAIAESGIPREEIFLTTKVWVEHYGYEQAKASVLESMRKLKTDYLDLVLLHQPFSDAYGAYRALEELYEAGKIRAIGISNFYVDRMVDFASFNRIKPMINQVETHIFNQQKEMKEWTDKYDIQLEAWAPFGEGRGGTFDNPVIAEIAKKYGKTPAQVMLRWHIQRGVVVIPKSTHIERMEENFNVFDFTLSEDDMQKIAELDKAETDQKIFFDGQIYDAFRLLAELIQKAEKEIILVDGYVDIATLNLLAKKKKDVTVTLYTLPGTKLSQTDIANFNAQYSGLELKFTKAFHDRFLILDNIKAYHVGASLKDAGKKCFGINLIQDADIVSNILQRLDIIGKIYP